MAIFFAGGDAMGLLDVQFAQHILLSVTLAGPRDFRGILLQREKIIRLHARDDALVLDRADEIADRTAAVDAPAVNGGAEKRQIDCFELRQIVPASELLDRLRCRARRECRDHFIRREAPLAARRHSAASSATSGAATGISSRAARLPPDISAAAAPRRHHRRPHDVPHAHAGAAETAAQAAESHGRRRRAGDAQECQRQAAARQSEDCA